jgi:hypothetical protein
MISCIIGVVVETGDPSTNSFPFPRVTIGPVPVHRIIHSVELVPQGDTFIHISQQAWMWTKCDIKGRQHSVFRNIHGRTMTSQRALLG